jgi:hypothetical protein
VDVDGTTTVVVVVTRGLVVVVETCGLVVLGTVEVVVVVVVVVETMIVVVVAGWPHAPRRRDEPRVEGRIALHDLPRPCWVTRIRRARGRAPPVARGVDRANVPAWVDEKAVSRKVGDVVQVDHDVLVRVHVEVQNTDPPVDPHVQVVVHDRQPVHIPERSDGLARAAISGQGSIVDAIVVDARRDRVEEVDALAVLIERVIGDFDLRVGD